MKLTVLIPTYNRAESLRKTLRSMSRAEKPDGLTVEIIVVDNNSSDGTPQVVEEMRSAFTASTLRYLFESKQGRSFALNTGISAADGDLVTAVDDDEEIAVDWFTEVYRTFRERWDELDFVGGKILPNWEVEPPPWVEPLKAGVICWRDFGDEEWVYTPDSPLLTGGHGIFKRSLFDDLGGYDENVGAKGKGFISGEDEVFYDILMRAGKFGIYNPRLVIYHYVPAYRLSKNYYRTWLLGVGISRHLAHRNYRDFDGTKLLGVPRWMYRSAAAGVLAKVKFALRGDETESLEAENQPLIFAGYFYGRHLRDSWADNIFRSTIAKLVKQATR